MEIKDEVELANVTEVSVQHLNEMVNNVKHNQLIVLFFNAGYEIKGSVPLEHDFVLSPLQEMSQFARSPYNHCADLPKTKK